ncbi:hypothetical protein GSI_15263 [Ganoderma sinense ZZ0214-1]|uniref:Uncharacterized protein n=1 Tax=Ganoderma sinense ZZ0214-1 TaxID=1077348 RepID=A0A2G8RM30_9APHY|nr:hypothetical protein GSI_15263 [Ganoderma sinense ZZ0214-1]
MLTSSYTLVEGRTSSPGTPSHSPPPSRDGPKKFQVSPANSDDSSIACDLSDLSFNYERNSRGEIVRVSKGSSKSSTPPTPSDSPPKAPSPVLGPTNYARPPALARSESLPQESFYPRQLQRTTSGSLSITPAGASRGFSTLAATNAGTSRKVGGPRRVRVEDLSDSDSQPRPNAQTAAGGTLEEKENQRARVIRPARSMGKAMAFERIAELGEDHDLPPPISSILVWHIRPSAPVDPPASARPRRPLIPSQNAPSSASGALGPH